MSKDNPLINQPSIDDIAAQCASLCLETDANVYSLILNACFKSKFQGIDDCINLIDSMLNADTSQLTKNERNMMLRTLNNLRTSYVYQMELMIKNYDTQV